MEETTREESLEERATLMQSAETDKVIPAIIRTQAALHAVKPNVEGQAGQRKYPYANLDAILDVARPVMAEHGLGWICQVVDGYLVTKVMHESGQWIASALPLGINQPPQQIGSQMTYFRRYTLTGILGVVIDSDDDDGAEAQRGAEREQSVARSRQQNGNGSGGNGAKRPANGSKPADAPAPSDSVPPHLRALFGQLWRTAEVLGWDREGAKERLRLEMAQRFDGIETTGALTVDQSRDLFEWLAKCARDNAPPEAA